MGDTELQYVDEGAASRPARRSATGGAESQGRRPVVRSSRSRNQEDPEAKKKKKKLLIRTGAVLVLLSAGFVAYKIIEAKKKLGDSAMAAVQARTMDELRTANQKGRNLIRDGKWAEAKAIFEALQESNPNFGGGTVQQYIAKCDQEIPNEQHLIKADELAKKGEVGPAAKELAAVTSDTLQTDRRDRVRTEIESKVEAKVRDGRDLMASTSDLKKMEQLLALADDILIAKEDQRDAKEYKETAEKSIQRIKNPYVAPPTPKTPWVAAQQLFANGDQAGAVAMANACAGGFKQCKTLMSQIQDFNEKNRRLQDLNPSELIALLELDRRITGGPASQLARPIAIRVVSEYYRKASSAKAKGDWGQAIEYARKVLQADPGHPGAQSIVAEARGQAKDLYLRGYQMKEQDPDGAAGFFKQVLQMTPSDDEFHQKAKKQLEVLKQ